jgi:hypothetical protein
MQVGAAAQPGTSFADSAAQRSAAQRSAAKSEEEENLLSLVEIWLEKKRVGVIESSDS